MSSPPNPTHGVDDHDEADAPPDPAAMEELRRQLADTDPAVVIANHAYGLFELAAVYLSTQPPRLTEAQLAIDALAGLSDAVGTRLGDASAPLVDALAQIRLAWVQLSSASAGDDAPL
jgi:hypothetical protein